MEGVGKYISVYIKKHRNEEKSGKDLDSQINNPGLSLTDKAKMA